ncbi:copper homeostasis protein [Williamsoniiplasma somnilux]|uniref:Copper homeostasis protein cutC homolog n=1 Tax=Williamsoniiplasma somnilux TaxID=215578 RepID=A0A2K8P0T8_9MOLU|nr:copper homeostasis protein CutC [Williamsoniiplasma somnilux]ATZ18621.1 copper homeostasis protein [Williamsoniiplasma somnilux]
MKLEVIAKDLQDIIEINKSTADRIEFCSELEVGGLTPDRKDIIKAGEISKLPVNVMLRPTARDFYYTDAEFEQMVEDAKFIDQTKVAGVVVGIITPNGEINVERMKKIIALVGNKTITFHKAFEQLKDPIKSLSILKELGVKTVLTSGKLNINESFDLLKDLTNQKQIIILAGGGVDFSNINKIVSIVNEVHVGTAVRESKSWNVPISIAKINEMKKHLL